MIIGTDINPQNQIYYVGALVLDALKKQRVSQFDFFDTFQCVNTNHRVSIGLYTLALDWLYVINAIRNTKDGGLELCF
jgi:hypothetical protein